MAALIYGLALGSPLSRPLATKPFVFLGEISYSVYILQCPLILWADVFFVKPVHLDVVFCTKYFTLLLLFAAASYLLIEKPARDRARAWVAVAAT